MTRATREPRPAPAHARRPWGSDDIPWSARLRVSVVWLVTGVLSILALVAPLPFSGQVQLRVGDVAPADMFAPRQVIYVSELVTKQRRDLAANSVPEVYDPPQARIGRQQLDPDEPHPRIHRIGARRQLQRPARQSGSDQGGHGRGSAARRSSVARWLCRTRRGNASPTKYKTSSIAPCARKSARTTWPMSGARFPRGSGSISRMKMSQWSPRSSKTCSSPTASSTPNEPSSAASRPATVSNRPP